jgi:tRNA-specific 2-thiouridylase
MSNLLTQHEFEHVTLGLERDKPIIVGMSGGVDSSVTAALLHHLGFHVIGVTFQLHAKDKTCCSSIKDVMEAKSIADSIGIQHHAVNYVDRFNRTVMKNFIDEYSTGTTPSPCVRCNQYIKFDELLSFATGIGAQAMATGHYIRHRLVNGQIQFMRADDDNKDQTYFMSMVSRAQMQYIRFPLGCMLKTRVREIAAILGLSVAQKRDSQDLCFIQNGTYRSILSELAQKTQQGLIIDTSGNVLGRHDGIHNYTVGQRKGLSLPNGPWFVLEINAARNEITVGQHADLFKDEFVVHDLNALNDLIHSDNIHVKIRARNQPVECRLVRVEEDCRSVNMNDLTEHDDSEQDTATRMGSNGEGHAKDDSRSSSADDNAVRTASDTLWRVKLDQPTHSITPGQVCAFYHCDALVGGGRIWVDRAG